MSNYQQNAGQRFIIPTSDWGFKRLFGTEMNKEILIGLLNRLLPEEHILDVTYINTELIVPVGRQVDPKRIINARKGTVDVYCKCQDGSRIIVEMQNWAKASFVDRAVVYVASSIIENYTITRSRSYDVKKTYFIAITGTVVFPDQGHAPVRMGLCDLDAPTTVQLSEKVLLMFVELPKFAECIEELNGESSFLDMFSVTMKTMGRSDQKAEDIRDELIEKMYLAADTQNYDHEEIDQYHLSIMTEIEYQATLEDYFNDGIEKGIEKGRKENRLEIAKAMKEEGLPIQTIMRVTGLPETVIAGL